MHRRPKNSRPGVQRTGAPGRVLCVDVTVAAIEFDAWMASRVTGLLRFAYLVTGDADAAEEAVQSALARAWERWDDVSRTDDPERYVRRMVVNENVSAWRRWRQRQVPVAEPRPRVPVADPGDAVAEHDAVWRVCTGLPRRQRAAVVLRYYEDCDYAEIATILGCSESTVRSQVHRALAALRTALEEQEHDDA